MTMAGQHLLTLEGLPRGDIEALLDRARHYAEAPHRVDGEARGRLAGIAVCTLFFEASTRTRLSFQRAAQRLGADVLNFDAATSSATKGETDVDTLRTIEAMGVRGFVIRHREDGAVARLAEAVRADTRLINAGDGRSQHPTQGLLDMLTIRQAKGDDFSRLKIAIIGDIAHSRVARSDLCALRALGATDLRVCAPPSLLPDARTLQGCVAEADIDKAIADADVVMTLRLQRERMEDGLVASLEDYHRDYGVTAARMALAHPDAVVMHPGPMNRGVEITDDVADGAQSLVLRQVANGVAVRMAVLETALAG